MSVCLFGGGSRMFFAACVCVCQHYRPAQSSPLYHPPTQSHKMLPPQKEKGWTEGHPAAGTFMLPSIHPLHASVHPKGKEEEEGSHRCHFSCSFLDLQFLFCSYPEFGIYVTPKFIFLEAKETSEDAASRHCFSRKSCF